MNIQFASFQQFLLMDGHGPYVWLAVIVSVAVLIGLVVSPLKQQKKIINQIARQQLSDQSEEEINASHS